VKYKHKSDYYRVLFVYLEVEKQYTLGGWPSSIIEPRCIRGRSYITSLLLRGSTRKQAVRSLQPEVGGLQRQGEARHVGQHFLLATCTGQGETVHGEQTKLTWSQTSWGPLVHFWCGSSLHVTTGTCRQLWCGAWGGRASGQVDRVRWTGVIYYMTHIQGQVLKVSGLACLHVLFGMFTHFG
jgi:hypothetical protein